MDVVEASQLALITRVARDWLARRHTITMQGRAPETLPYDRAIPMITGPDMQVKVKRATFPSASPAPL